MSRSSVRRLLALLAVPLVALVAACDNNEITGTVPDYALIDTTHFAASLNIGDLATYTKTTNGVYYKDLLVGTGDSTAAAGKKLLVHYVGWLPNGKVFDQSSPDREPFAFTLGAGNVIRGWDEGIVGMKVGGHRLLIIPPQLAYGLAGSGSLIPGNSVLVFRVDLYQANGTATTSGS